jgi:glutamate/tyrosine decarboxylase-like PLP-dependent enzyme
MIERLKELEILSGPLEPSLNQRNQWLGEISNYLNEFIDTLDDRPAFVQGNVSRMKHLKINDQPQPLETIIELFKTELTAFGIKPASGGHMGYIPGGGVYSSSLGDLMAAVTDQYAGIFFSNPGAVVLENQLIQWMCEVMGYPATAHGNITSGGSIANLIAIVSARDKYNLNRNNLHQAVFYTTEQIHHCVHKAIRIAGLTESVSRVIPMDDAFRMDITILRDMVEADQRAGLIPFMIIASAGTTDTGSVDPLDMIADICEQYNIWFHIDGAYGGFFNLIDRCKPLFKGIERSDSLAIDPHKGLFLPYGIGTILFKDVQSVMKSHHYRANYMKDAFDIDTDEYNPCDLSPELTKHFRGPRMWLPLHLHGLAPFKAALEEKLLLAQYFYKQIKSLGFETGPEPALSITIFRYIPERGDANEFNNKLVEAIHKDGRVFFSSTTIKDNVWIRCAILGFRTHLHTVDRGLNMLKEILLKMK